MTPFILLYCYFPRWPVIKGTRSKLRCRGSTHVTNVCTFLGGRVRHQSSVLLCFHLSTLWHWCCWQRCTHQQPPVKVAPFAGPELTLGWETAGGPGLPGPDRLINCCSLTVFKCVCVCVCVCVNIDAVLAGVPLFCNLEEIASKAEKWKWQDLLPCPHVDSLSDTHACTHTHTHTASLTALQDVWLFLLECQF